MSSFKEDPSLKLLTPVPDEQLLSWLAEFYGREVGIASRELLRHRDLSYVERLTIAESLPNSLIYKLVLPPWDIEQELHQHVLIPSISNSAQLYLTAHYGSLTALFMEDLGTNSLLTTANAEIANRVGEMLAKMHRAYSYRIDELIRIGVLRTILPLGYADFVGRLIAQLVRWNLLDAAAATSLLKLAKLLAAKLAGEPTSLVHGDFFAENIILRGDRLFVIDWSWFTILGVPLMDLASITLDHPKNGSFTVWKNQVIEAYCFESARDPAIISALLPYAQTLNRLFFLHWLVERKSRGIMGTTRGPVDHVIPEVVSELQDRLNTF